MKKLFEIVSFRNGKGHEKDISDNGKYIVVNSKFISSNGQAVKLSDKQYSPLKKDEIVMVMSDVPNGKAIAKCFLIDSDNKYSLNQRICAFEAKEDSRFLFYKLNRNKYFLAFDDGAKQTNLSKNDILLCNINIPQNNEQNKISNLLTKIDDLILVKQKEITLLDTLFKYNIEQRIYNTNKLVTLDEICMFHGDGDWILSENIEADEKWNIIQLGNIGKGCFVDKPMKTLSQKTYENLRCTKIEKGYLLINRMVDNGNINSCILNHDINAVTSVDVCWIKDSPNINVKYINFLLQTGYNQRRLNNISSGSGRVRISKKNLFNQFYFSLPSIEEQNRVVLNLEKIQYLTAEQESNLEFLKKVKKFTLAKMMI